ncbi:MAG TPA: hypothetical protein DCE42_12670 [Myxococcales bacterium]|nr:hypothetical protein [Deltaproteobacteria bacterium]MBU50247.1 hypothetical protein [Deltaproteobacteria bacterium]HAA55607.1 hypothetical protein [Myxococcales bacterium]|tara:strand:- start:1965 stop:2300 length:336 start_codon:yes stop_codon:yes gene_type:complete
MSENQTENTNEATKDEQPKDFISALAANRCPLCHTDLIAKKEDQWVRSYNSQELYLPDVESMQCPNCNTVIYPQESLDYFDKARNGDIPDLKTRPYTPEEYDDDEDEEEDA